MGFSLELTNNIGLREKGCKLPQENMQLDENGISQNCIARIAENQKNNLEYHNSFLSIISVIVPKSIISNIHHERCLKVTLTKLYHPSQPNKNH